MQSSSLKSQTHRLSSLVTSWVLIAVLITSPVMAQTTPQTTPGPQSTTGQPLEENNRSVAAEVSLHKESDTATGPSATPKDDKDKASPPGRISRAVVGVLIVAGAILIAALLFRGNGDKPEPPRGPEGTILTPGTPRVNPPPNE